MSTISSFKSIKSKHDAYRGKDCMKKFWEPLREQVMERNNFKKEKMKLLREWCEKSKNLLYL